MASYTKWAATISLAVATALLLSQPLLAQKRGAKDEETCFQLQKQWQEISMEHKTSPKYTEAEEKAKDGMARCQEGAPEMGGALLGEAISDLGVPPIVVN